MVHDRQFPAMAGNAACLQIFPGHPAPPCALVAKPFESTLAAQGPADLQGIGQTRQRGAIMAGQKERITISTRWGSASAEGRAAIAALVVIVLVLALAWTATTVSAERFKKTNDAHVSMSARLFLP